MKHLFVGGPADGQRVENPHSRCHRLMVAEPFNLNVGEQLDPSRLFAETHLYEGRFFHSGDQRYSVYFHSSIQPADTMAALIDGYRLAKPQEPPQMSEAEKFRAIEGLIARIEHIKGLRVPEYLRDELTGI